MVKSYLNLTQTAAFLGISTATVRNWRRNGLLPEKRSFDPQLLAQLKREIASGRLHRLASRANKRGNRRSTGQLAEERSFYQITLAVLENAGEIERDQALLNPEQFRHIRRAAIRSLLLEWWHGKLHARSWKTTPCEPTRALPAPDGGDYFGAMLEAARNAGTRSGAGAFYTPPEIAESTLSHLVLPTASGALLDPGCGTGRFLLAAARNGVPFDALFGIDRDALALRLAAFNLLLAFPEIDRKPHLSATDFLTGKFPFENSAFQTIVANPPWGRIPAGAYTNRLKKRFAEHFNNEYFALFLRRAAEYAPPGGELLFLLPEAFLSVRRHQTSRDALFSRRVTRIEHLGRQFKGVFSEAVAVWWKNEPPQPEVEPTRFLGTPLPARHSRELRVMPDGDTPFHEPAFAEILRKIHIRAHFTLRGRAEWTLGIVTGNNVRHLVAPGTPGSEPVLRGCDIFPLRIAEPAAAICYTPEAYQQCPPESRFRVPEKLIYRFIATVPIFAVDRKQSLTLNSANCITLTERCIPTTVLAAIFNSPLYAFLFRQRCSTRKILRSDLEDLPIPHLDPERIRRLASVAENTAAGRIEPETARNIIDDELAEFFQFTSSERSLILAHAPKWRSPAKRV